MKDPLELAQEALHKVDTHEAVCAERYKQIHMMLNTIDGKLADSRADIKGLYSRWWAVAGATVALLVAVIFLLVKINYG